MVNVGYEYYVPFIEIKLHKEWSPEPIRLHPDETVVLSYNEFISLVCQYPNLDVYSLGSSEEYLTKLYKGYTELVGAYLMEVSLGLCKELMFAQAYYTSATRYRLCVGENTSIISELYSVTEQPITDIVLVDAETIRKKYNELITQMPVLPNLICATFKNLTNFDLRPESYTERNLTLFMYICLNYYSGFSGQNVIYDWEL